MNRQLLLYYFWKLNINLQDFAWLLTVCPFQVNWRGNMQNLTVNCTWSNCRRTPQALASVWQATDASVLWVSLSLALSQTVPQTKAEWFKREMSCWRYDHLQSMSLTFRKLSLMTVLMLVLPIQGFLYLPFRSPWPIFLWLLPADPAWPDHNSNWSFMHPCRYTQLALAQVEISVVVGISNALMLRYEFCWGLQRIVNAGLYLMSTGAEL